MEMILILGLIIFVLVTAFTFYMGCHALILAAFGNYKDCEYNYTKGGFICLSIAFFSAFFSWLLFYSL